MIYVLYKGNKIIGFTEDNPFSGRPKTFAAHVPAQTTKVKCSHDWKSLSEVEEIAAIISKMYNKLFIGTDSGDGCYPRFDIIEPPQIGDKVSYGFNGDYYPDGEITKISKSLLKITTSGGHNYLRRKKTGAWLQAGGAWHLVSGHRNDKNPSF